MARHMQRQHILVLKFVPTLVTREYRRRPGKPHIVRVRCRDEVLVEGVLILECLAAEVARELLATAGVVTTIEVSGGVIGGGEVGSVGVGGGEVVGAQVPG